jgi:hypothetical protein
MLNADINEVVITLTKACPCETWVCAVGADLGGKQRRGGKLARPVMMMGEQCELLIQQGGCTWVAMEMRRVPSGRHGGNASRHNVGKRSEMLVSFSHFSGTSRSHCA